MLKIKFWVQNREYWPKKDFLLFYFLRKQIDVNKTCTSLWDTTKSKNRFAWIGITLDRCYPESLSRLYDLMIVYSQTDQDLNVNQFNVNYILRSREKLPVLYSAETI